MIAPARPIRTRPARGLTLLELLVVIFIISILLAVAIPVFRPPVQERAIREAARMVNSAFAIARTKALETGDSWGVMFDPLENAPAGCKTLHYVKVPPPYAGDTVNSRLIVRDVLVDPLHPADSRYKILQVQLPQNDLLTTTATSTTTDDNVRPGDMLVLNYTGHRYQVLEVSNAGGNVWDINVYCDTVVVWPRVVHSDYTVEPSQAFQFTHLPTKASLAPVQLPALAAVDIDMSGIGSGTFDPSPTIPVIVTFAPSGELDLVYSGGTSSGTAYYGQKVRVFNPDRAPDAQDFLHLKELEVYSAGVNVGLAGTAASSTTQYDAGIDCTTGNPAVNVPGNVNDGCLTNFNHTGNGTSPGEWVEIDLGSDVQIDSIVVYPRFNSAFRLQNYSVQVFNSGGTLVWESTGNNPPHPGGAGSYTVGDYSSSGTAEVQRPSESLHMLIGKPGAYGAENLADLGNIWVSIGSHSGQLTSAENAAVLDVNDDVVAPSPSVAAHVRETRKYARSGKGMGG